MTILNQAGLYVHIPFCRSKCIYCDFCSYPGLEPLFDDYVTALRREAQRARPEWEERPFDTLYVGGGTPTTLQPCHLISLLQTCRQVLDLEPEAEATIEANPGTVDKETFQMLAEAGYNRLSLGVQSFDDQQLALLGRIHTGSDALAAFEAARLAGLKNISLDLIFGLPSQTLEAWRRDIEQAIALHPEHLSLYGLTVEEGTPLADRIASGNLPSPDDDLAADMYELAQMRLDEAGYLHYEISNWARRSPQDELNEIPQLACRHNLHYWRNEPYLGLGAAAYSYDGQQRCGHITDPAEYIRRVATHHSVEAECETVDRPQAMDETMMLGLRLIRGVSWQRFRERFGVDIRAVYAESIEQLEQDDLLQCDERGVRLTKRGRLLGNRVFAAFLR